MVKISVNSLLNPASKRRRSSIQDDSEAGPSKRPSRPAEHNRDHEELLDAVVSNVQNAIDVAINCTSGIPIVSQVLPPLQALVKKIASARANNREKRKVLTEIENLVKSIQSIGTELRSCADALRETTHTSESDPLSSEMSEVVAQLNELTLSIQKRPERGTLAQFVYSEQDSDFLEDVRHRISAIRSNLEIQNNDGTRRILAALLKTTRAQTQSQRCKDDQKILKSLLPVNASYKSALLEAKTHLQRGTRAQILRDLDEWVRDRAPKHRIHVLHGPAGTGKSSIAHALCCHTASTSLGASFFFVRGSIADPSNVFPTLAYQLAHTIPELFAHIANSARTHLLCGQSQLLDHQIVDLLRTPLEQITKTVESPLLLVLDGIDECANDPNGIVQHMMQLLCRLSCDIPLLRILIATRPESYIMDVLQYSEQSDIIKLRNLRKEPDTDDDICFFITTEFQLCSAPGFRLTKERPDAVELLTQLSDGLFIFANTAVRHLIQHKDMAVAVFDELLKSQQSGSSRRLLAGLDTLYAGILRNVFGDFASDNVYMETVIKILTWIALYNSHHLAVDTLQVLRILPDIAMDVIDRLRSVLIVDGNVTTTTPIQACHASFPQFLTDPARCTDPAFLVDPPSGNAVIAASLLDLLARDNVDSLRGIYGDMPQMWVYANLQWEDHLLQARYTPELGRALRGFVETHMDDWLRHRGGWVHPYARQVSPVDICAKVRRWYEKSGPDDGLVEALDDIIDRRVKELVTEAAQSPDKFHKILDMPRIKSWSTANGYTPLEIKKDE